MSKQWMWFVDDAVTVFIPSVAALVHVAKEIELLMGM